jgi:hypothetical protein
VYQTFHPAFILSPQGPAKKSRGLSFFEKTWCGVLLQTLHVPDVRERQFAVFPTNPRPFPLGLLMHKKIPAADGTGSS